MSTLYLIRHGQASFGADDYDVLSELGADQSRRLGQHLADRIPAIDAVYAGPRRRHADTARHMLEGAASAGVIFPDPIFMDELDEYHAPELMSLTIPMLAAPDPELRAILAADDGQDYKQRFMGAFQLVVTRWARGEIQGEDLESFAAFSARVRRVLGHIMAAESRRRRVAVVTSAGPISIAMQMALGISDEKTLRVGWSVANASMTEFRYRDDGDIGLICFNTTPHLQQDSLITYL